MAQLDKDIDDMMNEIKSPTVPKNYIYERNGKVIYRREFGAPASEREVIKNGDEE